jgi:hypothetical protein
LPLFATCVVSPLCTAYVVSPLYRLVCCLFVCVFGVRRDWGAFADFVQACGEKEFPFLRAALFAALNSISPLSCRLAMRKITKRLLSHPFVTFPHNANAEVALRLLFRFIYVIGFSLVFVFHVTENRRSVLPAQIKMKTPTHSRTRTLTYL